MKQIIVFFVLGFNQKILFDLLYKEMIACRIVVFTTLRNLSFPKGVQVIDIKDIAFKPYRLFRLRKDLNSLLRDLNSKCVVVYMPHVVNFLSNYFAFIKRVPVKKVLTYDGILNMTDRNFGSSPRWIKVQLFQVFKACMIGIRYRFVSTEITGEQSVGYEEVILPIGIKGKTKTDGFKVRRVWFPSKARAFDNICLLLEQPIINGNREKFCRELGAYLKKNAFNRIVLKAHPMLGSSLIYKSLKEQFGLEQVELYYGNTPAEYLIGEIGAETVISTNSSALVNAKIFYPNVKVISFGLKYSTRKEEELRSIFRSYGIVIC